MQDHAHDNEPIDVQFALSQDHARLEGLFQELMCAFEGNARQASESLWTQFDSGLRSHFALEETQILPRFALTHPVEAAELEREHKEILHRLEALGIGVDLHLTRADTVEQFVRAIRAHASREDRMLYQWAREATSGPVHDDRSSHLIAQIRRLVPAVVRLRPP